MTKRTELNDDFSRIGLNSIEENGRKEADIVDPIAQCTPSRIASAFGFRQNAGKEQNRFDFFQKNFARD